MADKSKTVEIIFSGVDKTGKAINSVSSGLDALQSKAQSVTQPLANVTASIVQLDAALGAVAIGLTGYAVKLSDDFSTSFSEIATIIGKPSSELQAFKNQIQTYAESSTASLQQITEATYNAISAGVDYHQSLTVISAAEKLSIAGRADLNTTTKALVSTINAFGGSMGDAESYADTFFTTVKLGQTTIPELSDSIAQVLPLASAAGISFDELGAAIAAITASTGATTTQAVTSLQGALAAIIKPSSKAAKEAKALGIEFDAAALKSKGLKGVLDDVAKATGGNTSEIALLFPRVEALGAVLPLTGKAAKTFASDLDAMKTKSGSAATAAVELSADLDKLVQTLQNNVQSALINYGNNFDKATQSIVKSLAKSFEAVGAEIKIPDGVFAPLIQQLGGVFDEIDQKFKAIAVNLPEALKGLDVTDLVKAFSDLGNAVGGAFTAIFGDIDLSSVQGLEQVLQKIIDAFTALVNVSSGIVEGLQPLFSLVGTGVEHFQNLDSATKQSIGHLLGLATTVDKILPAIGGLSSGLNSVGNGLIAIAGAKGLQTLVTQFSSLKSIASGIGKGGLIGTALFGSFAAGYGIGEAFNKLYEQISGNSLGVDLYNWIHGDADAKHQAAIDAQVKAIQAAAKASKAYADQMNDTADAVDKSGQAKDIDVQALQKQLDAYVKTQKAASDYNDSQNASAGLASNVTTSINQNADAVSKVGYYTQQLVKNNNDLEVSYDQATGKVNGFSGTVVKSGKSLDSQVEKTKKAIKQSEQYQEQMAKLASDERIKKIEATVDIKVADIRAQSEEAKAIINSLNSTITSTGQSLTALYGDLSNSHGSDKFMITDQIQQENKRREKALEEQTKLTDAQIALIKKKTDALASNGGLVKIEVGPDVGPAVELVIREILDKTKVWATEAQDNFLLGTGN